MSHELKMIAADAAMVCRARKTERRKCRWDRERSAWVESCYRKDDATFARTANIAYAYMLGREYEEIEGIAFSEPDWEGIEELVMENSELDPRIERQAFAEWIEAAKAHYYRPLSLCPPTGFGLVFFGGVEACIKLPMASAATAAG